MVILWWNNIERSNWVGPILPVWDLRVCDWSNWFGFMKSEYSKLLERTLTIEWIDWQCGVGLRNVLICFWLCDFAQYNCLHHISIWQLYNEIVTHLCRTWHKIERVPTEWGIMNVCCREPSCEDGSCDYFNFGEDIVGANLKNSAFYARNRTWFDFKSQKFKNPENMGFWVSNVSIGR